MMSRAHRLSRDGFTPPRRFGDHEKRNGFARGREAWGFYVSERNFDRGVILRAHRFRAELVGYRLERGHYMDQDDDRADRWYAVPVSEENPTRSGSGFKTSAEAAAEAERLAAEAEKAAVETEKAAETE